MIYCDSNNQTVYIPTGQIGFGQSPEKLSTVLGACIALNLYNSIDKIGGMAHILYYGEGSDDRFAVNATRSLLSRLNNDSGRKQSIVAKIVGGNIGYSGLNSKLKRKNESILLNVVSLLVEENINIEGMHTGGQIERNVLFDLESGDVIINLGTKDLINRRIIVI
ncbi:MAG: chemotaxis protein CheD [Candidatus Krumholzibacteriota bacterium]|nr:chemotaxis protein CheD [Candidatus Krumholzibacteriota bacterium]